MDDERIIAKCYLELGEVTKEKGEYDESLRYHQKSMEIFERIDDALSLADSHLNIADVYKARGEFKQAMTEYEKGFSLYEDVYVDDANKPSDTSTDISLASSSFSDLQHTKSLSKSDSVLPQATLINSMTNKSKESIDDSVVQSPVETTPVVLEANNSLSNGNNSVIELSRQTRTSLPSKAVFILLLSICLTGILCWSCSGTSLPTKNTILPKKISRHHHADDLSEQLRKYLGWQKDRLASLNKNTRRILEEFLTESSNETKISVDRFQRLVDSLGLKLVLVPK